MAEKRVKIAEWEGACLGLVYLQYLALFCSFLLSLFKLKSYPEQLL